MEPPISPDDRSNSPLDSYFLHLQSENINPSKSPHPTHDPLQIEAASQHLNHAIDDLTQAAKITENGAAQDSIHQQIDQLELYKQQLQNDPTSINSASLSIDLQNISYQLYEICQVVQVIDDPLGVENIHQAIQAIDACISTLQS